MMKNRTLIGIVCIILAVVITFGVSPMINKMTEGKTEVVSFAKNVSQGAAITDDDIQTVKIAKSALPEKAIKEKSEVVGKYANSDLYKGDIATPAKITDSGCSGFDPPGRKIASAFWGSSDTKMNSDISSIIRFIISPLQILICICNYIISL